MPFVPSSESPAVSPRLLPAREGGVLRRLAFGLPLALAASACLAAAAPTASDSAVGPRFEIYQYVVEGNSLLKDEDIELAVSAFLGEGRGLRDVEAARAALEKRYHAVGYLTVLVAVPDQAVDSGEVRLRVVEAPVERLNVAGAEYTLPSAIKAEVPELAEGNVPNFNKIQEQLAQVNRRADARVTPILRAGRLPGTVEVQLDVDDQLPLHANLELNNRQTPNTTAERATASLRYDNLWQRGHSLSLMVQTAPQRVSDARVAALTYVLPTGHATDVLSLYAVHSRSEFASLASAPGLGLLGNSDTFGLRYSMPLRGSEDLTQNLSAGLDLKDVKQTLKLEDGQTADTPIRYVPLAASYSLGLNGKERSTAVEFSTSIGLRGLLGNSDSRFEAKRSGASAGYVALRSMLQHTETRSRWSLMGRADLQLASGPLVPTEQMVAGGAESVRGYLEGERTGDMGLRATVELRTPAFNPGGVSSAWRFAGLAFLDGARLTVLRPVAPQPDHYYLAGTGVGLRATAPGGFVVDVDLARALVKGDTTPKNSTRLHARAIWGY